MPLSSLTLPASLQAPKLLSDRHVLRRLEAHFGENAPLADRWVEVMAALAHV
jgi:hypothetical protein